MNEEYRYSIDQCDVPKQNHSTLRAYRDKRRSWLEWIGTDEHHAIFPLLSAMAWRDVSFRSLIHISNGDSSSSLHNPLLYEALVDGHVALQILAIRRLVDNGKNVISLRKLLDDMKTNAKLLTRENFVCFDGLPFDSKVAEERVWSTRERDTVYWGSTTGPDAYRHSQFAHEQFDKLAGINCKARSRNDRLPVSLLKKIESDLYAGPAYDLAKWSHAFLAHAGSKASRASIDESLVTLSKISSAIKSLARIAEKASSLVRSGVGELMPHAQFDKFKLLNLPVMKSEEKKNVEAIWRKLSEERNHYLDELDANL
jgi:hypothetical protein